MRLLAVVSPVVIAALVFLLVFTLDLETFNNSSCVPSENDPDCPDKYFATTYFEARKRFRIAAAKLNAKTDSAVAWTDPNTDLEYTIDFAFVEGTGKAKESIMIVVSGTHGVEGYAGSAIQLKLMETLNTYRHNTSAYPGGVPSLALVHAVNPTGMALNRRFNHNNVDLNRNWLTPEGWEEVRSWDPDATLYITVGYLLNPKFLPTYTNFLLHLGRYVIGLLQYGLTTLKRATVSGTYRDPTGIFYGGNGTSEINVEIVKKFLKPYGAYKNRVMLDLHTGLGIPGVGILLTENQQYRQNGWKIFGSDREIDCATCGAYGATASGYEKVRGAMIQYHGNDMFPTEPLGHYIIEFGTVITSCVGAAVVMENAAYIIVPNTDLHARYGRWVRYVFNLPSLTWKRSVIRNGVETIEQAMRYQSAHVE